MIRIVVRPGRPADLAYVVDTWVKRGRKGERLSEATASVRASLAAADTELRVACLDDDPDAILGWSAVSGKPPRLLYVYVRKDLRGQGVARALLTGVENPRGV